MEGLLGVTDIISLSISLELVLYLGISYWTVIIIDAYTDEHYLGFCYGESCKSIDISFSQNFILVLTNIVHFGSLDRRNRFYSSEFINRLITHFEKRGRSDFNDSILHCLFWSHWEGNRKRRNGETRLLSQTNLVRMEDQPKGLKYKIRPFASGGSAACFSTCCVIAYRWMLHSDFPFRYG